MAADEKRPQWSLRSWTGSTITTSSDKLSQRLGRISEPDAVTQDLSLQERNVLSPVSSVSSGGGGDSEHTPCINGEAGADRGDGMVVYRSYKRRWFGLAQLTLMNVMVSWVWMTYAPVASSAASYYGVTTTAINWISTAFFLAFVAVFPLAATLLHRSLHSSFICSAVLLLAGNWLRYAGSASRAGGNFACAMAGSILVGFAQPLVLAAPTKYSDLWFTDRGRVTATALASLANPFGAALGQLVNPFWVSEPGDVSRMVLYVAIISTVCCVPSFFLPSGPPTPVGPSSETPKLPLRQSLRIAVRSPELWLILAAFSVFVGLFNAVSTLLNQIMVPYGFSDDQAGIGGAILIVVGLLFAAVSSPVLDRTKAFLPAIKILVPLVALCYLAFVWMPATRTVAGPYVVLAVLGAGSFALVPIAVEFLTDLSHPISPALTSTTAWAGGQLFGAVFVVVSNSFVAGPEADPPNNMNSFLVFQAVLAIAVTPAVLVLGLFGREDKVALKRLQHQEQQQTDGPSPPTTTATTA